MLQRAVPLISKSHDSKFSKYLEYQAVRYKTVYNYSHSPQGFTDAAFHASFFLAELKYYCSLSDYNSKSFLRDP